MSVVTALTKFAFSGSSMIALYKRSSVMNTLTISMTECKLKQRSALEQFQVYYLGFKLTVLPAISSIPRTARCSDICSLCCKCRRRRWAQPDFWWAADAWGTGMRPSVPSRTLALLGRSTWMQLMATRSPSTTDPSGASAQGCPYAAAPSPRSSWRTFRPLSVPKTALTDFGSYSLLSSRSSRSLTHYFAARKDKTTKLYYIIHIKVHRILKHKPQAY